MYSQSLKSGWPIFFIFTPCAWSAILECLYRDNAKCLLQKNINWDHKKYQKYSFPSTGGKYLYIGVIPNTNKGKYFYLTFCK